MIYVARLPHRLGRWLGFMVLLAASSLVLAGRVDLPMLDAFLVACAVLSLIAILIIDPELVRERWRRGQAGEDPVRLTTIRLLFLSTFVFAFLDVGRLHWSNTVPPAVQLAGLAVFTLAFLWELWAVSVNRFFVPVIRVQSERGHHVISNGPYAIVRHPGYAAMVVMAPAAALALGSWWAMGPALMLSALLVARTAHEDRFLIAQLADYAAYARGVRWRLLRGVW